MTLIEQHTTLNAARPSEPVTSTNFDAVSTDAASVRKAFGRFPSGLAALCAEVDGEATGIVASSFSVGVSFDPALVMFSVQNSSTTWPVLRLAPTVGVSILGEDHDGVAAQLASRSGHRFRDLETLRSESGSLFIAGSSLMMNCTIVSETPAGDHHIVLLEVKSLLVGESEPLIHHGSSFRKLHRTA
jgi:flavin reductase (DIM6/NTAB) family NADH-FMN oxidoreductase RutF